MSKQNVVVTQEWDNVVFKKRNPVLNKQSAENKNISKISHYDATQKKLANATDVDCIEKMPRNIIIQLIAGRVSKKLSQKDLANQLNIPIKTIQDIESYKHKKDMTLAQKIARKLGIQLVK